MTISNGIKEVMQAQNSQYKAEVMAVSPPMPIPQFLESQYAVPTRDNVKNWKIVATKNGHTRWRINPRNLAFAKQSTPRVKPQTKEPITTDTRENINCQSSKNNPKILKHSCPFK